MVIAIIPGETWEWIHPSDRELEPELQTVFEFRVLSDADQVRIANQAAENPHRSKGAEKVTSIRAGTYQLEIIRAGLHNVRNLRKDPEKVEASESVVIPYETRNVGSTRGSRQVVTDAFLDHIPHGVKVDMANAIEEGNTVSEDDRKN